MKKAAEFVSHIIDMLSGIAKEKRKELKKKTRAFKTRMVIFSLLHDRNMVVSSWSHKLKAKPKSKKLNSQDQNMVVDLVVYSHNAMSSSTPESPHVEYVEEEEELRDAMFKEEGSVIDMARQAKEEKGEEFRLEEEIDKVADLFITRFHQQMLLQKQLSLDTIPDSNL